MMRQKLFRLLKGAGCLLAVLAVVFVAIGAALNTSAFQRRLLGYSARLLSERLGTQVAIDRVRVSLGGQSLCLYGLEVDDLQRRKMLQADTLAVRVDLWALLHRRLQVLKAEAAGVRAQLYKPAPDSAANYQFIIDAFRRPKASADSLPARAASRLTFDMHRLALRHVSVTYNKDESAHAEPDVRLSLQALDYVRRHRYSQVQVDSLCFATDNHRPRKNAGKPKRGAFDAGHLDVAANLTLRIDQLSKDTLRARLTDCRATDRGSGLALTSLHFAVEANPRQALLSGVDVSLPNTALHIDSVTLSLPNKKTGNPLTYSTSTVSGQVLLKDISQPFAPVLGGFTLPLRLGVRVDGDDQTMNFRNVAVSTTDRRLTVAAEGRILHLRDKRKLDIRFDVSRMQAKGSVKEQVIRQFPVKTYMMKQLAALGDITYRGRFSILWKREVFQGVLQTAAGPLHFQFAIDETGKYLSGTARSTAFQLGRVVHMPKIGAVACTADFGFDISKQRTARIRRLRGGKLPVGYVKAHVAEASYAKVRMRNLYGNIRSDGVVATGDVTLKGSRVDGGCTFSFTSTDSIQRMRIKPVVKFHKKSK